MRVIAGWGVGLCVSLGAACFQAPLERDTDEGTDTSSDTDGVDAEVGPDTVTRPVPSDLAASVERVDDIELTWSSGATAFWVYRCDSAPCTGEWRRLHSEPLGERKFRDTTALPAGSPQAPTLSVVEDARHIDLSWDAVVAPSAPRYSYRVSAVDEGGESAPSSEVMGHRAERPVVGYEVSVAQGEWQDLGAVTTWRDGAAGPPTLSLSGLSASQGTFTAHVELVASGVTATAGPTRSYRVRAVSDFGPGAAAEASGGRRAPPVTVQWQRSELEGEGFEDLPLATAVVSQDTSAPADGSARYYRVVLSGEGAQSVSSGVVTGWRQPPPGVLGGLSATTELLDSVRLTWQAVPDALGYHVYRGEQRLTSGNGIAETSYEDFDTAPPGEWLAPSSVTASTTKTEGIELSWVAPARPVGASASYSVSAVNASGEGMRSASVTGRRSAPALNVWEIEVTTPGATTRVETAPPGERQWLDEDAPLAQIVPPTVSASQGDHRAYVALRAGGAQVTPAALVSYRLRGQLVGGGGTPWSTVTEGRRAHGVLAWWWERSAGDSAQAFSTIADDPFGDEVLNDESAPEAGERRWYRLAVTAQGAQTWNSEAKAGWRLAFSQVVSGAGFSCARTPVTPDGGRVWCWGDNTSGQLGRGHTQSAPAAARVPGLTDVRELASGAGAKHVCARDAAQVYCWGDNTKGQIGDGSFGGSDAVRAQPTLVPSPVSNGLSVGGQTTCSSIWRGLLCWGDNELGQVGVDLTDLVVAQPTQVRAIQSGRTQDLEGSAVLGSKHGCAVGRARIGGPEPIFCWGSNEVFQLARTAPASTPLGLESTSGEFAAAHMGGRTGCVLYRSGELRCWGSNSSGQLAQPVANLTMSAEPLEVAGVSATAVAVGEDFVCTVLPDRSVRCWGNNANGRLGNNGTTSTHVPQTVLTQNGNALSGVTQLAAGSGHVCGLVAGAPYCWGAAPANSLRAVPVALP